MDIGRNNYFCSLAVSRLCKCLERLELNDFVGRRGFVEHSESVGVSLLYGQNRFCLTLSLTDFLLLDSVRLENSAFLKALGYENLAALLTLGVENSGAAFTFRLHLLLHRVLNLARRKYVLELNADNADTPRIGRLVKDNADLIVDRIARGERVIELKVADDVSQSCCGEVLDRAQRTFNAVGVELRVGDFKIHDRINLHCDVIACDNGLRRKVDYLLLERNLLGDSVDKRNLEVQSCLPCCVICAQTLDHICVSLRHDFDVADYEDQYNQKYGYYNRNADNSLHELFPFFYNEADSLDFEDLHLSADFNRGYL